MRFIADGKVTVDSIMVEVDLITFVRFELQEEGDHF